MTSGKEVDGVNEASCVRIGEGLQDPVRHRRRVVHRHLSTRLADDRILIKSRPTTWKSLAPDDLIVVDYTGKRVDGPPSDGSDLMEWPIHTQVYRAARTCSGCCTRTVRLDADGVAGYRSRTAYGRDARLRGSATGVREVSIASWSTTP